LTSGRFAARDIVKDWTDFSVIEYSRYAVQLDRIAAQAENLLTQSSVADGTAPARLPRTAFHRQR
jgi:hypothetical protein